MENTIQIAERIKQLRKRLHLNQSDFCKNLGIKQSTLSSYENGTVSPSNEVLYAIAKQYHVSLDWLFGISDNEISLASMGDVVNFLLEMNEIRELRYELEINDKLFNDRETEGNRWYASIKFYGNEKDYPYNADMCQFLASLNESRESYESYFTPKEMFDIWKKQKVSDYSPFPVTRKTYQELDTVTRLKLRNEYLEKQFQEKKSDSKKN